MEQPRVWTQAEDKTESEFRTWSRFTIILDHKNQSIIGTIELIASPEEWDQYGHELNVACLEVGLLGEVDWTSRDEDDLQVDVVRAAGA